MMENPTIHISRTSETARRMIKSSQLFTRIDKNIQTNRKLQTSKDPRAFRNRIGKQSLDGSKQNAFHVKYISKIKSALKENESTIASNYLLSLRKQYDKMEKNIKNHSSKISVMKKQINFMRDKLKYQTEISTKNNYDRLKKKQEEKKEFDQKQEQAAMQTKILYHIISRMKQEHIKNKNIWNYLEKTMKEKTRELKIKEDEIFQWDQSIHRIFEQITKIKQQYNQRNQDRSLKIQDYKNYVNNLEDQQKFQQDRRERTFQLLSMESNDIMDAKNVVLRDVLMTNKVLDKVLQFKINDLLHYYQGLQNSYHLIKTETNISDPQALTKKFFSYSQNFEQLTAKISCFEQKQQSLLQRNKQLKQIQREGLAKKLQQDKSSTKDLYIVQEQRQKLIQECLQKELTIKKIKSWADKINDFLGLKKNNFGSVTNRLNSICQFMKKQIEQQKTEKTPIIKFQSAGVRLKKIIKQFSQEQLKLRRSQALSVKQINTAEKDYLCESRRAVKNKFLIKMQTPKTVKI